MRKFDLLFAPILVIHNCIVCVFIITPSSPVFFCSFSWILPLIIFQRLVSVFNVLFTCDMPHECDTIHDLHPLCTGVV
jgi:hypothetical protein